MQKMILGGLMVAAAAALGVASEANAQNVPYCREYQQQVTIGGIVRNTYGTACQQPDGSWVKSDQDVAASTVAEDVQQPVVYQQPVYIQQPVVYQEPVYYPRPYIYPSVALSFGFNDWHDGHGGGWHGGGWHGGGGRWH